MILITGAGGKTGQAVLRALHSRRPDLAVRAWVHHPGQAAAASQAGAGQVISGDLGDPAVLQRAVDGIQAIYLICPNMSVDEVGISTAVLRAAASAGVNRVVYHSVLYPLTEEMPHHWQKLRVEEYLIKSGLDYTILQPAAYMQNILAYWKQITEQGVYSVPYAVETRLGMVDLEDVAGAAARVLSNPAYSGGTFQLAGPQALTQVEVAERLSLALGRPVRAEAQDRATWEKNARKAGMPDYSVATLVKMFQYYEQYGFWGSPQVLSWILGRPPARFDDFLARVV